MSELEPGIEKSDDNAHSPGGDKYTFYEKEKNPSFLLGAISFVIALLFIIIYFNAGYNSVLLLGAIIFGLAGMLLISSREGKPGMLPLRCQESRRAPKIQKTHSPRSSCWSRKRWIQSPLNSRGKWITCWYRWKASQAKRYWSEWVSKKDTYCSDCTRARH